MLNKDSLIFGEADGQAAAYVFVSAPGCISAGSKSQL